MGDNSRAVDSDSGFECVIGDAEVHVRYSYYAVGRMEGDGTLTVVVLVEGED